MPALFKVTGDSIAGRCELIAVDAAINGLLDRTAVISREICNAAPPIGTTPTGSSLSMGLLV
jgi:hypothetical protein